ncbi:MAG: rRNA maturation RNase YbeY [Candidatus Omnitrophica bacterium]|nr:rRNA maturation RNase YbeY [Candidatus Omnitrophota bacterium]
MFRLNNRQRKAGVDCGAIRTALERCPDLFQSPPSEIEIILVSDRRIRELNRRFLNKNTATDIMTFRTSRDCGEIVIAAETAAENGRIYGLTAEYEIIYLIVHGYLHLKNYRDCTEAEKKRMFAKQDRMFKKIANKSGGVFYGTGGKRQKTGHSGKFQLGA